MTRLPLYDADNPDTFRGKRSMALQDRILGALVDGGISPFRPLPVAETIRDPQAHVAAIG